MKRLVRAAIERLIRIRRRQPSVASEYRVLPDARDVTLSGWLSAQVATRQQEAYAPLLENARRGSPRRDFVVAAEAVQRTGLTNPTLLEVGCGSGYYSEVLPLLLGRPIRYVGVDYGEHMVSLARRTYARELFVAGDARELPFRDGEFEVVFSGNSLMHIARYEEAIRESARISGGWCVFHTVPLMKARRTTLLRKRAYGEPVVEIIFNKSELEGIFARHSLQVEAVFESIPYDVSAVVNERTWTSTYLCRLC